MHRVLIVDDSKVARVALGRLLARDGSELEVVGVAGSADEARAQAHALGPDLITMDVELAGHDGVALCRELLGLVRTRVVVVTGVSPRDPDLLFRSLAAGALDVLPKPSGAASAAPEQARFVRAVRALAGVPLLRSAPAPSHALRPTGPDVAHVPGFSGRFARVLVGVSTGGPPLLASMLKKVPPGMPAPMLIVQHIAVGFGEGFARWLGDVTGHDVRYCARPTPLEPGVVYIAPDDSHLSLVGPQFARVGPARVARHAVPSVDELFESAALYDAPNTMAVLLTGMGSDGAGGLLSLRRAGATTIAQTPRTCVVGSMPESAIARGAPMLVLGPDEIAKTLVGLERTGGRT